MNSSRSPDPRSSPRCPDPPFQAMCDTDYTLTAGNRWHIDCFRCNTCGTLLDSDANLLLLGDGSLICNNCTYSCSACNNKIEDLAILTGDQAFCASCFRCRNCKRKIENLRYARTSQGIFCMSCHESLMARRRKKSKTNRQQAEKAPPIVLDKSLPALPPSALPPSTFSPELETPPEIDTPDEFSPRPRAATTDRAGNLRREASPASVDSRNGKTARGGDESKELTTATDPQTLPASTYREKRRSAMPMSTNFDDADGMFANVPFALDPNTAPGPSPLADSRTYNQEDDRKNQRDYFNGGKPGTTTSHRELLRESRSASSRSSSVERRSKSTSSPHIAFQEKSRGPQSGDRMDNVRRKDTGSAHASPNVGHERPRPHHSNSASTAGSLGEGFKLQEVPKDKKAGGRIRSKSDLRSPDESVSSARKDASESSFIMSPGSTNSSYTATSQEFERMDEPHPMSAPFPASTVERPKRGDSLGAPQRGNTGGHSSPSTPTAPKPSHERKASTGSGLANRDLNTLTQMNGGLSIGKPVESPTSRNIMDGPPPRSATRPVLGTGESFVTPRHPPQPPGSGGHRPQDSISSTISDGSTHPMSPSLLRYSAGNEFSVDEDMARIFKDNEENHSSVLRRVSNAVKHGRSFSDRGSRSSLSHKWKSPHDIGSPSSASPDTRNEATHLRAQLRQAHQRIGELESEVNKLNESASKSTDIKQVNSELKEKRGTIAVLDTQREVVMRELDIMTEHLKAAKDQQRPLDLQSFQSAFFRDFAAELEKFKTRIRVDIEELVQKRNEVNDDILNLIKMKDKGYTEYESLSQKNAQLADLNNQLVQTIQDLYKSSRIPNGSSESSRPPANANPLGIYTSNGKDKSDVSITEIQKAVQEHQLNTMANEMEESTIVAAPKVVHIPKAKPNKFNWKKGGQAVAKNVTKGLKGAFASQQQISQHDGLVGGVPYGALQPGTTPSLDQPGGVPKGGDRAGFGFFGSGQKNTLQKPGIKPMHAHNNSTTQLSAAESLFGSDLTERCEFEKATIPSIVRRCIQEVELRGMDKPPVYIHKEALQY